MASMLEGIITHLESAAGVSALVGAKVYANFAPQGTETPYIIVEQTAGVPGYHSTAEDGTQETQFTATCYGGTPLEAVNVAEQVRLATSGKTGGDMGGVDIRRSTIDDIREQFTPPAGEGDEVGYPAQEVLINIWHNITIATF